MWVVPEATVAKDRPMGEPISYGRTKVLFPDGHDEVFDIKPGEDDRAFRDHVRAYAEGRGAVSIVFELVVRCGIVKQS